jgi:hypothetical protein
MSAAVASFQGPNRVVVVPVLEGVVDVAPA